MKFKLPVFILCAMLGFTGTGHAQAVWADFAFAMKPGSEAKVAAAFEKYFGGSDAFTGLAFMNRHVVNGANPQTHNVAIVQPSMEAWEAGRAAIMKDPNFAPLAATSAAAGQQVNETLYIHVAGFGKTVKPGSKLMALAMKVDKPGKYIELLADYAKQPGNLTEIAGIDIFATAAGGTPGVTHVAVLSLDKTSDFYSHAQTEMFQKFSRKLGRTRTILGTSLVENVHLIGPMDPSSLR